MSLSPRLLVEQSRFALLLLHVVMMLRAASLRHELHLNNAGTLIC